MSVKVFEWLENLGLGQYAAAFEENDIGWDLVSNIDQETLKDIGVNSAGHRLQILKAVKSLHPEETAFTSSAVGTTEASSSEPVTHAMGGEDTAAWMRTPGERKPVTMLFADSRFNYTYRKVGCGRCTRFVVWGNPMYVQGR